MTRQNKTIISLIIIFLVVLVAIYLIIRAYKSTDQQALVIIDESANEQLYDIRLFSFDEEKLSEKEEINNNLKGLAFTISETFGSYSYQGDYRNINDLRVYMTDSMQKWADEYIKKEREDDYSGEYNIITTNALAGELIKLTEEEATVLVLTSREVLTDTNDRNFQQHIIINFSKVGTDWKVDGILWL